jgi:hypothetical protein
MSHNPGDCPGGNACEFRLPGGANRVYPALFKWWFVRNGQLRDDFDPLASQREAAMFYGLFLRGHSVEALRRDIDIPRPLLQKWLTTPRFEPGFRDNIKRVYQYRKQVLAIFEELVGSEKNRARLQ